MKVGYFTTKYPYSQSYKGYSYGGSTVAAYYLAREISKKNYKIDIFTTSVNSRDIIEKQGNITVYRFGTTFRLHTSNISVGMFRKPVKQSVDIAHVHFDIPPGPFAALEYVKKRKVPLIVTYHGDWYSGYGGLIRRIGVSLCNRYLVDKLLSNADIIISPSRYYIKRSTFLGKYEDKLRVIPNGINIKNFDIPLSKKECRRTLGLSPEKKIILFLGNLSPYKGPDVLVKAMSRVIKHVPEAELIFVGRGVMEYKLRVLSKNLEVHNNIKFAGFVEDDMKVLFYNAADVFCLPSTMVTECYPLVILEAMACGLPVVASDIGGIPDSVKDGENGHLVPPNDVDALANTIINLLNNKYEIERLGRNGRSRVESYSWKRIAEETVKVYGELL